MQPLEEISSAAEELGIDVIQLKPGHGFEKGQFKLPVIQEVRLDAGYGLEEADHELTKASLFANAVLLDLRSSGLTWEHLKESYMASALPGWCENYPIILDLDFTPQNIHEILKLVKPKGIQVRGGEEIRTGVKDFEEIDYLLEELEL